MVGSRFEPWPGSPQAEHDVKIRLATVTGGCAVSSLQCRRLRSADGLTVADADDPQPGQRCRRHLDADALAGAHVAQAAGIEHVAVKGDLAAVVKQHAARAALIVVPVHAGLHGIMLVPGQAQYRRGVRADPDGDGMA